MTGGGGEVLSWPAGVAGEQAVSTKAVRDRAARSRLLKGSGKLAIILTRDLLEKDELGALAELVMVLMNREPVEDLDCLPRWLSR